MIGTMEQRSRFMLYLWGLRAVSDFLFRQANPWNGKATGTFRFSGTFNWNDLPEHKSTAVCKGDAQLFLLTNPAQLYKDRLDLVAFRYGKVRPVLFKALAPDLHVGDILAAHRALMGIAPELGLAV